MADQFRWGVWLISESPIRGKAAGAMAEDVFRKLLSSLTAVTGSTDSALDRIKEIMTVEMHKTRLPDAH